MILYSLDLPNHYNKDQVTTNIHKKNMIRIYVAYQKNLNIETKDN